MGILIPFASIVVREAGEEGETTASHFSALSTRPLVVAKFPMQVICSLLSGRLVERVRTSSA